MCGKMEPSKSYDPKKVEEKWYAFWLQNGLFRADADSSRIPFSMVIPPPNITGALHIGHAFNNTLQDIVVRWKRMQGYDTLWLPGTDHAGITTQNVVEKHLAKKGLHRSDLGREEFEKEVWRWKEKSEKVIILQLQKLGASLDWSRKRFTLDEGLSRAVRQVFVELYKDGLIYRDKYIVNWCPRCKTAISDLEVDHVEVPGKLYYIKYPIKGTDRYVVIATTRPETMLGDTALAVHPDDERFAWLDGKKAILPLVGRELHIIKDTYVNREFGTGIMKVTPAHDPLDFQAGMRHNLSQIIIFDEEGMMNENAGKFKDLDRYRCREEVVEELKEKGFLLKIEDYRHAVGHCDRCRTVTEPYLSTQWFVKIKPLAQKALEVVNKGKIKFIPSSWTKTYYEWMTNIHDWCISRQLWWGHRIPVWHCSDCQEIIVEVEEPKQCRNCGNSRIYQDEDVLDTWFSSALWPFSTLGWPEKTKDLERYYPTTMLITGFDILFFWVARMIMMGTKFIKEVPFYTVYFNGLIRDEHGDKMSKSKGNVIDLLEVIEKYGADAVRFTLAVMASPGVDIPLSESRMSGYRAFTNKLWNASRFVMLNISPQEKLVPYRRSELTLVERWIKSRLNTVAKEVNQNLEKFRFHETSHTLYHFIWHEFCDWYIEMVKPYLSPQSPNERRREVAKTVLIETLEELLRLTHPFMPFITEEIWQKLPHNGLSIATAEYPTHKPEAYDEEAEHKLGVLMELVTKVRNIRAEMNISPSQLIQLYLGIKDDQIRRFIEEHKVHIINLARVSSLTIENVLPSKEGCARGVVPNIEIAIPLIGLIDFKLERLRLQREIAKVDDELVTLRKKLSHKEFLTKAPPEVVAKNKERCRILEERLAKLIESSKVLSDFKKDE